MYTPDSFIFGDGTASAQQIDDWFHAENPSAPALGDAILRACTDIRINSDLVAAEIAEETGYWTSKIALEKNNPAGLGAVDDDPSTSVDETTQGAIAFSSPEEGILAQVAHLATYALGEGNPLRSLDPRYSAAVSVGYAGKYDTLRGLATHWASDPKYHEKIAALANNLTKRIGANPTAMNIYYKQSPNYTKGRVYNGVTYRPSIIIIHTTEGGYAGAVDWLTNPQSDASAHAVVKADGSEATKLVSDEDASWAAGWFPYNLIGINIEQEGYALAGGFTDGLYRGTAELVREYATKWSIPIDRNHVIGHYEVPSGASGTAVPRPGDPQGGLDHHYDPGPTYDWDKLMAYAGGTTVTPVARPDVYQLGPFGVSIGHGFAQLYQYIDHGGNQIALRTMGYPNTEEFIAQFSDNPGQDWTLQGFERGFMQWEAGNAPPWDLHTLPLRYSVEMYLRLIEEGKLGDDRTPYVKQYVKQG